MAIDIANELNLDNIRISYLVDIIALSTFRLGGFLILSPILVKPAFSNVIRTGFLIAIGFMIAPSVHAELGGVRPTPPEFAQALIKELILGFLMAFLAWLVVHAMQLAGVIIDTQRGATTAQDFNPIIATSTTNLSNLLVQIFTAYFFAVGGMLAIIQVLYTSYTIWPVMDPLPDINLDVQAYIIRQTSDLLHFGLLLAAPVVIATLAVDLYVAYLSKKAQQLQPLTFSGPIKTVVAIIIVLYSVQVIMDKSLDRMIQSIEDVMLVLQEEIN